MLRDVAAGLAHLHSQNIVHRDVALRNVLLRDNGTAVVADLGLAREVRDGGRYKTMDAMPIRWSAPVSEARPVDCERAAFDMKAPRRRATPIRCTLRRATRSCSACSCSRR
jgi:serine/threonine protein kinase